MAKFIIHFFSQFSHEPMFVYGGVCVFMLMSAFGFPLPEEIILVSSGLMAYMSRDPIHFPPPTPNAPEVNVYWLATIAFFAVVISDSLIFAIGSRLGPKLFAMRWFQHVISPDRLSALQRWMWTYGYFAVFVFRFTPGVRFPGHLTCGALKLSRWKFLAVDALAAGISVPTQILLVAFFGQPILYYFGRFRLVTLALLVGVVIYIAISKFYLQKRIKPGHAQP